MRKIVKNAEPKEWVEFRQTPGAKYEAKPELVEALLKEQGYLCAYCMRRIPVKDVNSSESHRVEHILPRATFPEKQLEYQNMVVCCPGAIDGTFHCDKSKNNQKISFDLFADASIDTLQYSSKNGMLTSSNNIYDGEINRILNLNNRRLMSNRFQILEGVRTVLNHCGWKEKNLRKLLVLWENKDSDGRYREYSGIVIWFLKRHLLKIKC